MIFSSVPNKCRGIKLVVDEKHLKTIPRKLSASINSHTFEKIVTGYKRLSVEERKLLTDFLVFERWKLKLAIKEKYLYELIGNSFPVSKRKVITLTDERLEIVLDNQIKIKVPDKVYYSLTLSETTINSNY
jgi:hypothetical protein